MTTVVASLLLLLLVVLLSAEAGAQLLQNATCVCTCHEHSCVLSGVGEMVCWGRGTHGRLGYGHQTTYFSPAVALAANPGGVQLTLNNTVAVLKIACGMRSTMTLLADGRTVGFGDNVNGELGLGHTEDVGDTELPWQAPGGPVTLSSAARDMCTGYYHSCVVLDTPVRWRASCWGDGSQGALGLGNTNDIGDNETVYSVGFVDVGGTGNVRANFCGGYFTLALMSDGVLRSWGSNAYGQLGLGHSDSVGDDELPSSQPDIALNLGGSAIAWVSGGSDHSCVVSTAGRGQCWGRGQDGRLGTGSTNDVNNPSRISLLDFGGGEFLVQLEAYLFHSCGVLRSGFVKCFGSALRGMMGCGMICPSHLVPNESVPLNGPVSGLTVASSSWNTLAIHPGGQFQAWGWNNYGQLGYNHTSIVGDDETPASVGNVNFTDGVTCARPFTETDPSLTATTATLTATLPSFTATQPSVTHASHTQTGITRTPRSRPATLGSSTTATTTSWGQQPFTVVASSSTSARWSGVLTFVLVGVGGLLLLVLILVVVGVALVVLRRRRQQGSAHVGREDSVSMETVATEEPVSRPESEYRSMSSAEAVVVSAGATKRGPAASGEYTEMPVRQPLGEYTEMFPV